VTADRFCDATPGELCFSSRIVEVKCGSASISARAELTYPAADFWPLFNLGGLLCPMCGQWNDHRESCSRSRAARARSTQQRDRFDAIALRWLLVVELELALVASREVTMDP
jgi:hypothetical protein